MADLKIAIMGAGGRMGRELVRAVCAIDGCAVSAATERDGSALLGSDAGSLAGLAPLGIGLTADAEAAIAASDAILDFTSPAATCGFAGLAARRGLIHIIGTTGFSPAEEEQIAAAARSGARIVKAGNMSLGVNLLTAVTRKVAAALRDFDIEVVEMHHKHKVDAPSGTALMLANAAAAGREVDLAAKSVRCRDGHTGARRDGDIGMQSLRGGSVVGDHTVVFAGEGERIELTHRAESRAIFARGAVKAALWASNKPPGLYTMMDVLGL